MRVAIAADHAGFLLKSELIPELLRLGHQVSDLGTAGTDPVDYPDFAEAVGMALSAGPRRSRHSHLRQRRGSLGGGRTSIPECAPDFVTTATPPIRASSTTT